MNLSGLVELFTRQTGYPNRGTVGQQRLENAARDSLSATWPLLPRTLRREEHRFELELPYTTGSLRIHPGDARCFVLTDQPAGTLPSTGVLAGRWLEIARNGRYYQRRVREVFATSYAGVQRDHIVIDAAWDNLTDTGLTYTIWTAEYPTPAYADDQSDVYIDPDTGPTVGPLAVDRRTREIDQAVAGVRMTGTPSMVSAGSFFQLPAPHYTPAAAVLGQVTQDSQRWGYDSAGVEHNSTYAGLRYGAAGTFSYRVCHGWGRRAWHHPTLGAGFLRPFYLSGPSPESARVSPTWGTGRVELSTPNIDYVYGFGADSTLPSFNRSGLEKWVFRARHAVEAASVSNHAGELGVEADSVYYLCTVTDASSTVLYDKGQYDPVDRWMPLRDWHGHQHLVFNRRPSAAAGVRLVITRRTETIDWNADVPAIPAECIDVLVAHMEWALIGKRGGNETVKASAYKRWEDGIADVARKSNDPGSVGTASYGSVTGRRVRRTGLIASTVTGS